MASPGPSGAASLVQILDAVVGTAHNIKRFCRDFQEAPAELHRINSKLSMLKFILEDFRTFLLSFSDGDTLPPDLRQLLWQAVTNVQHDLAGAQSIGQIAAAESCRARGRLAWAVSHKGHIERALQHVRDSEATLDSILLLLNLRYSALTFRAVQQQNSVHVTATARSETSPLSSTTLEGPRRQLVALRVDSFLRQLGFYGYFIPASGKSATRLYIGYCPPAWLTLKTITLDLQFARTSDIFPGLNKIDILPSHIRIQNRVAPDSPFMTACRRGDTRLIRQHLTDGTGHIGNRTSCLGKTPLMLAIESENLYAIQLLLEAGANPNDGDDDQVLPISAIAGYSPRRSSLFPQLPPKWDLWLDGLSLLVQYGASVHELAHGRPLGTFNVAPRRGQSAKTLEFVRLLSSESYQDFDAVHSLGKFSVILTAIWTPNQALDTLKLISNAGVTLTRIASDGRTPLHEAAELARETGVVEFLCSVGGLEDIDRQDQWGWTPLHYAVLGELYGSCPPGFQKLEFLLSQGADIEIRAGNLPRLGIKFASGFTAFELAANLRQSIFEGCVEAMKRTGRHRDADWEARSCKTLETISPIPYLYALRQWTRPIWWHWKRTFQWC